MWQIGIVVEDRDAAMAALSDAFGVSWVNATRTIDIIHGDVPMTLDLDIAIARQGPLHLEVIGAVPGSPWYPGDGLNHVAYWADDLLTTAAAMKRAGFTREVTYQGDPSPTGFTYHRAPSGLRIEHVDASRRPAMMGWLGGGEYPDIKGGSGGEPVAELAGDNSYAGGGPVIGETFHVGVAVTDLESAMAELTDGLGLEWHSIQERSMHLRTATGVVSAQLRFTYSKQTPHIELLHGDPGSIWGPEHRGIHHIGVWTDDLTRDSARLAAKGYPIEVTLASRSTEDPQGFTYQRGDLGLRVELVPTSSRPAFDNWFGGGEFA
jgi:catechol 2,3-dioxygenase-like lactoylglutathione lyase family enzyme